MGEDEILLEDGWQALQTSPGEIEGPAGLEGRELLPATVPGTAAGVLRAAGLDGGLPAEDLDGSDWWFRTRFAAEPAQPGERVALELDGIATLAEVFLNGERILTSSSMFAGHALDVGSLLESENDLAICCRALAPLLAERRRPRARWRTKLVSEANLRFFRTMLLGRTPGFAPSPAAVGPWRPVRLRRTRGLVVEELRLRTRLDGDRGVLAVTARVQGLGGEPAAAIEVELDGPSGIYRAELAVGVDGVRGELEVPAVACWWPHTHGDPALHAVRLLVHAGEETHSIDAGRVGFRSLAAGPEPDHDIEAEGLALHVNGVAVFARGAVWTPVDPIGLAPGDDELRATIESAREAGLNVLRVVGTGAYESTAFHELCDELGVMVWQDFMFANLDYPIADEAFRAEVEAEAHAVCGRLAAHPSTAVFCGNSEIEQQAAMFGVDPSLGRGELFGELLPQAVSAAGSDAVYIPSAPFGGDLPFRPDRGVANYFGVGGYRRPLSDARLADVRFASECLAIANVPEDATLRAAAGEGAPLDSPSWKRAVPGDVGTDWDFDDVRDHYFELLYGLDPAAVRAEDPARYLALSRAVSGEVMAEVFGEWRRAGSRCAGGIVLWLRDLLPGAGWGLIDSLGEPKVVHHHLRRSLAPVAVWTTDEGFGGVGVEIANDSPAPLSARLRVGVYRQWEQRIAEADELVELGPHEALSRTVEGMLGRFIDASYAYRFGPPAHDLIAVSLERPSGGEPISQAFRFPVARPLGVESAETLGLAASARSGPGGAFELAVSSRRFAYGVRVLAEGFAPSDDAFSVEPGAERVIVLSPRHSGAAFAGATLTALNLGGQVRIGVKEQV